MPKLKWVRGKLANEWLAKYGEHLFSLVRHGQAPYHQFWRAYVDGKCILTGCSRKEGERACEEWADKQEAHEKGVLKLHQEPQTPEQLNAQRKEEATKIVLEGWALWMMQQEDKVPFWSTKYDSPQQVVEAWLDWMAQRSTEQAVGKPLIDVLTEKDNND